MKKKANTVSLKGGLVRSRADELRESNYARELYQVKVNMPPEISAKTASAVSSYRRDMLEEEVERGLFREPGREPEFIDGRYDFKTGSFIPERIGYDRGRESSPNELTPNGFVSFSTLKKRAAFGSGGSGGGMGPGGGSGNGWRGSNDAARQIPETYSPLWLGSNLNLPRDHKTINMWARSFFSLNPIVHNSISLHATYPISKLNIKCKNRKVEQFFADMNEEIDLMNVCVHIAQEYWNLGEAIPYAELDQGRGVWKRILIQNPDYISIMKSPMSGDPMIFLKPDQNLIRIINSNHPADIQQRRQISPEIVEFVKKGKNIPLSNYNVSHIARKIAPYEIRGTGLTVSCFRQLMLLDKFRESDFAQADNFINPLTLVKVGDANHKPSPVDLEQWRNVLEESQYDKDAKIVSHNAVDISYISKGSGIYDTSTKIQQLIKEIYIGLMVPSVIMDSGDTTYASGSISLDVLRQRYMQFRNMLGVWLRRKIFAPISEIQGFYEYSGGEKRLIVPDVDWNHMSLFDMNDHINNLIQLARSDGEASNIVSVHSLYRSLGLEWEEEQRKIRYEDIQRHIRIKENLALERYSLSELRTLTPDDEISDIQESPLPGESPYSDESSEGGDEGVM